jgi:hypothetical protein
MSAWLHIVRQLLRAEPGRARRHPDQLV